jgi:hypothetical protein
MGTINSSYRIAATLYCREASSSRTVHGSCFMEHSINYSVTKSPQTVPIINQNNYLIFLTS